MICQSLLRHNRREKSSVSCESRSLEEAQRLCENWLVGQDRCYRN